MLNDEQRTQLKDIARRSIEHGLAQGGPLPVSAGEYAPELRDPAATFVTLQRSGDLRGCIGMLKPVRSLVEDVAHNAYAAAFEDPRFSPMQAYELGDLDIHVSVLGTPEALEFSDEKDLLSKLRPGIDGLILSEGPRRGTFLPSVWKQLPAPADFLAHLKHKAGLPGSYWSDRIEIQRYRVEEF